MLHTTHDAIHQWARSHARTCAGHSWEIYGNPSDDPANIETTVVYLLASHVGPSNNNEKGGLQSSATHPN